MIEVAATKRCEKILTQFFHWFRIGPSNDRHVLTMCCKVLHDYYQSIYYVGQTPDMQWRNKEEQNYLIIKNILKRQVFLLFS